MSDSIPQGPYGATELPDSEIEGGGEVLYRPYSTVARWPHREHLYADVGVTWLRAEEQPAVPYERALQGYNPAEPDLYRESTIDDLFTLEEAEQLQAYLLETYDTETELIAVPLPLPKGALLSPGVLPTGGTRDLYPLIYHEGYSLPFMVNGFYDVDGHRLIGPTERSSVQLTLEGSSVAIEGLIGLSRDQRRQLVSALERAGREADFAEWEQNPPAVRLGLSRALVKLVCGLCGTYTDMGGIEMVLADSGEPVCFECGGRFVPHVKALQDVCNRYERYFWYSEEAESITGEHLIPLLEQEGTYTLTPTELEAKIAGIIRSRGLEPEPDQPEGDPFLPGSEYYLCPDPHSSEPTFGQVDIQRWEWLESSPDYATQAGYLDAGRGVYCRLAYPCQEQPLEEEQERALEERLAKWLIQQRPASGVQRQGNILSVDFSRTGPQELDLPF